MRRALDARIRTYNLYGEQGEMPDVVHCERISTRAPRHDWTFPPHRHPALHQLFLMEQGGGRAGLDGQGHELAPMTLFNIPHGVVHEYAMTPGSEGFVLTLTTEAMDQLLPAVEGVARVLGRPRVIRAGAGERELFLGIMEAFDGREFGRAQVLRSCAGLILARVAQAIVARADTRAVGTAPTLYSRFEALIDDHFAEHWRVRDYARALSITPAHLTRTVRRATGRPATRVIEERLVREARRLLAYTSLTVSQVAYDLGFEDPAYFSRVFARATGSSPRVFRERSAAAG